MSVSRIMQQAAAGNAGEAVYVDDVFSTYLYQGNGSGKVITNGIALGDGAQNNTELHLTGDDLLDSSPVAKTITVVGNAHVSTSTKKYGTGSLQFDGSGDLLRVASNAHWNLNDEDFTIEFWANPTNSLLSFAGIISAWDPTLSWLIETVGSSMNFYYNDGSSTAFVDMGSISTNTWTHFAVTAEGSTLRTFKDGTLVTTTTKPTMAYHSNTLSVGAVWPTSVSSQGQWNGYIDDLRVTVGTARYTASFTPPTAELDLDTLVTGEGGLVWIKARENSSGGATAHVLQDTARGVTKWLSSDASGSEATRSDLITAFNSNGFSLGNAPYWANENSIDYASWSFRKQPGFFDVVTYTGDGTVRQIPHSLGCVPGTIIVKRTDSADNWYVQHRSTGPTQSLFLDMTTGATTRPDWGNTAPTSSEFTVDGTAVTATNASGAQYVAYLFAHDDSDESLIKCGSYTGNGSDTGPVIDLGFEPQWVMIKAADYDGQPWAMFDAQRSVATGGDDYALRANASNAENSFDYLSFLSNGFQLATFGSWVNASDKTYIYMAIRRPNKPASEFAATDLFKAHTSTGTSSDKNINTGFPVDLGIFSRRTGGVVGKVFDRLRGGNKELDTTFTGAEYTATGSVQFDDNLGVTVGGNISGVNSNGASLIDFFWRRAPGFFDVVAYTGDGVSGRQIPHNLGAVPQLMITKIRSAAGLWRIGFTPDQIWTNWGSSPGAWQSNGNIYGNGTQWIDPTESVVTVHSGAATNQSGSNYIQYLFGTLPGISKVGKYTGTGSAQDIDCGFSGGARFVMITNYTNPDYFYVWDSERGIITGSADPRLAINSSSAQVTTNDALNAYSGGFGVTSNVIANSSGDTYIFLAIA